MTGAGRVVAVNVSAVRAAAFEGPRPVTAIDKRPARGPVAISVHGLAGDEQADLVHHGGPDQAIYAYAAEDLIWWSAQLGRQLPNGTFGENISTAGLDVNGALIGERWRLGTAEVQVTSPRIPCRNFAGWMGEGQWMKRFANAGRPGAYLRVLAEGHVQPDDPVVVVGRPAASLTVAEALRAYYGDWDLLPRLIDAPDLASRWAGMAGHRRASRTISRLPDNPAAVSEVPGRE